MKSTKEIHADTKFNTVEIAPGKIVDIGEDRFAILEDDWDNGRRQLNINSVDEARHLMAALEEWIDAQS